MFVFLLIAAELALLYWVYWYLYAREPKHRAHINGAMWGSYNDRGDPQVDPFISYLENHRNDEQALKAYVLASEFVWDDQSKRYVPIEQIEAQSLLRRMAAKLDRQLSVLNVRP
jgi:hypothetical protein